MSVKAYAVTKLIGLGIVDSVIPIPILVLILTFVVLQIPTLGGIRCSTCAVHRKLSDEEDPRKTQQCLGPTGAMASNRLFYQRA